jgi:capsule polysaccharide export protein KpsC/LpsZ
MKISLFTQYGALNSMPIFQAFEFGAKKLGYLVYKNDKDADILVIWSVLWYGRMKNNQEIWNFAKKHKKKLIIIEIGALIREKTWRIGLNHVNNLGFFNNHTKLDYFRPQKLGISLKNRNTLGDNILICGQHSKSEQWTHRPHPEIWLKTLIDQIKKYTDRPIVFRPHPRDLSWCHNLPNLGIDIHIPKKINKTHDDFDILEDFKSAWCVFSPSSNPGIQAIIAGIPVFTDKDSLAYPLSNTDISLINQPILRDREKWLINVCHTEYLVEEIEAGIPLLRLLTDLDI